MIDLKHLKTLVAIADAGSFHAAAQRMCVTQSAISMQVKSIEEQLHTELFDRSVRPPKLNNAGRLLLDQAREIVILTEKLEKDYCSTTQFEGSVYLGTIPGASFILPDTLYYLNHTHRHLRIRVLSDLTDGLIKLVEQERLDAALVTEPAKLHADLISRPILREPLLVLASRDQTGMSDVELLENNRYIGFNRRAEVSHMIEASFRQRGIRVDTTMELDTLETFQMMIIRNLGVGILPTSSIRDYFADDFYKVPFGSPALQRNVSLVHHRAHRNAEVLDTLYQALVTVGRKHQTEST